MALLIRFPISATIESISFRITEWIFVGSSLGGMFLPWLIGQLFMPAGPGSPLIGVVASPALGLGAPWALVRQTQRGRD